MATVTEAVHTSPVETRIEGILDSHARKHVGVAAGVSSCGGTWTFARGRVEPGPGGSAGPGTRLVAERLEARGERPSARTTSDLSGAARERVAEKPAEPGFGA
jgi:hypothetical protein